jgi:TetR/AcrR family transcriptional regulator, regulator of autoinduction and epiphytic fitness
MFMTLTSKISFKQKTLHSREEAIMTAVNHLLAEKGFDAMTVDEVAAKVGIAKASLYKHFRSKEALAAAAMIQVLERTLAFIKEQANADCSALKRLKAVARWTMQVQLAGEMPALPAQNSSLRDALTDHPTYMDRLLELSEQLGKWISSAQEAGEINPKITPEVVLYTLFARACDPVLLLLKAGGLYSNERIIDMLLATCFEGLSAQTTRPAKKYQGLADQGID